MLDIGEIRIRETDTPQSIATSVGVFEVLRTGVTVLVKIPPSGRMKLMLNVPKLARQRAQELLASRDPNINRERAEAALARAVNRLRIAGQQ